MAVACPARGVWGGGGGRKSALDVTEGFNEGKLLEPDVCAPSLEGVGGREGHVKRYFSFWGFDLIFSPSATLGSAHDVPPPRPHTHKVDDAFC